MKVPLMTITQAKQLDAASGGTLLLFLLIGKLPFEMPGWLRGTALAVSVLVVAVLVITAFFPKEKSDERAVKNERQADSIIFQILYLLAGIVLAGTLFAGNFSIAAYDLALIFVLLWLGRSSLFLALERFGV